MNSPFLVNLLQKAQTCLACCRIEITNIHSQGEGGRERVGEKREKETYSLVTRRNTSEFTRLGGGSFECSLNLSRNSRPYAWRCSLSKSRPYAWQCSLSKYKWHTLKYSVLQGDWCGCKFSKLNLSHTHTTVAYRNIVQKQAQQAHTDYWPVGVSPLTRCFFSTCSSFNTFSCLFLTTEFSLTIWSETYTTNH